MEHLNYTNAQPLSVLRPELVRPQMSCISEVCSKSTGRWRQIVEDHVIAVFPQHPADKMCKSVEVQGGNVVRLGYRPDSTCLQ